MYTKASGGGGSGDEKRPPEDHFKNLESKEVIKKK